jgi:hypothetical protein
MRSPIESARSKLRWARIHLQTFNAETAVWQQQLLSERNLVTVRLKPHPEAGENAYVGIVTKLPRVPDRFPLIAGDIVHSLRGALDHIAWIMADRNAPARVDDVQTQFPIIHDRRKWTRHPVTRWTHYISPSHVRVLERLQPYHTADPPEDHPLSWVDDLANRDKHRRIHTVAAAPDFLIVRFTAVRDCIVKNQTSVSGPLEVGEPAFWFSVEVTGSHPQVKIDSVFTPTVGFAEGPRRGLAKYVLPNLVTAVARVARICDRLLR